MRCHDLSFGARGEMFRGRRERLYGFNSGPAYSLFLVSAAVLQIVAVYLLYLTVSRISLFGGKRYPDRSLPCISASWLVVGWLVVLRFSHLYPY